MLAGAAAALPAWSLAAPQVGAAQRARLGVTTVCFRGRYAVNFPGAPKSSGESLLGAPRFIRDTLGLTNFELWSLQFEADTPDYCDRLRAAAGEAGGRIINIQLDGPYDFSSPDAEQRARSLTYVKGWMDRARRLGSPSLRANFSGLQPQGPFPLQQVADAFRQLAAYGRSIGVKVLVENHIGHSVSVDNVVAVLKAVDDPWCRAIADWGNSPARDFPDRLAQMGRLAPWLELVSAKGLHFDGEGRHLDYDVGALTRATEASGFRGIYSIELFAGPEPPADPIAQANAMEAAIAPNLKPATRA
jgi:sugar phosphate isomerase/epimerase